MNSEQNLCFLSGAIEEYISACADWTFFAAKEDKEAIGFLCLKETGKATVELAVMGVLKEFPLFWDEANPCQIYVMSLKDLK